jgi:hypothetical protein
MTADAVASAAELSVGKATGAVGTCPPLHAASAKFNEIANRHGLKQAWKRRTSNDIKAGQARHYKLHLPKKNELSIYRAVLLSYII